MLVEWIYPNYECIYMSKACYDYYRLLYLWTLAINIRTPSVV